MKKEYNIKVLMDAHLMESQMLPTEYSLDEIGRIGAFLIALWARDDSEKYRANDEKRFSQFRKGT